MQLPLNAAGWLSDLALPSVTLAKGDLWMLAGFVVLGWTLARMTIRRRRRIAAENRQNRESEQKFNADHMTALPISDAPPETQRWYVAMFELQRELKAELDSRIAVVQNLVRQADEKIARLESLEQEEVGG